MTPSETRRRPGPAKTNLPTINDVAEAAGVSAATVSRALRNPEVVSSATRSRVAAAAREVGYSPAASTKLKGNKVLALIPRLGSPFFTPFLDAVTDLISESGYCITVGDLRGSRRKEEHYARALRDGSFVGAVLFTGAIPRDGSAQESAALPIPVVLACNDIPGMTDLPVFDVADRKAAKSMVSYLVGLGHRRIAHIRGPADNIEANERLQGYREAIEAAGLAFDEDLVWEGDFYLASGIAAAGRYLASADRPTAVFSGNDQMAMGFITEIKAAGFSVPGDVSVAGFDDIEYSVIFDPPLTTMRQPREDIGRLAAIELLRRIGSENDAGEAPRRVRLECELVVRASTQALRLAVEQRGRGDEKRSARRARQPQKDKASI
ncbi:MAG: LacI family DNA-binding transcriptional regulator [Candidatus Kaistia colombiensis]|nr:MAG: LacI family DNA-binding transcriptional regulator [Kaistia sp.]